MLTISMTNFSRIILPSSEVKGGMDSGLLAISEGKEQHKLNDNVGQADIRGVSSSKDVATIGVLNDYLPKDTLKTYIRQSFRHL